MALSAESRLEQKRLDFRARLRKAMKASGLNQKELAARLSIAESSVTGWLKHNAMPGADILFDLPYVLGVSADWLLAERGDRQPPTQGTGPDARTAEGGLAALDDAETALREVRRRWEEKRRTSTSSGARRARQSSDVVSQSAPHGAAHRRKGA